PDGSDEASQSGFQNAPVDLLRNYLGQSKVVVQVVADFVQDSAESPGVHQAMIRELDQRERISIEPELAERDPAAIGRGRKTRPSETAAEPQRGAQHSPIEAGATSASCSPRMSRSARSGWQPVSSADGAQAGVKWQ